MAVLAIWYCLTEQSKSGNLNDTKVGIISRDDKAAKKLMSEIQKMVFRSKLANLVKKQTRTPLNKTEIHFVNNSWIKCYPPTASSRGETFDLVIVDEAGFVDDEIFRDVIEPTVSASNGKIILSSTPAGQKGFFYEIFDPFDLQEKHEYVRFWFNWRMCENAIQKRIIEDKYDWALNTGNIKSFDQEYNALFTADQTAFFDNSDIDKNIDEGLTEAWECSEPCSVSIDYGITNSKTCITVVTKKGESIILLFQFAKSDFDENLLMDANFEHSIPNLAKRYQINHIIVDDCAQGHRTNQQLENEGYPVFRFNFRSDQMAGERNRGYFIFRTALKKGRIKYPNIRELISEMKTIEESQTKVCVRVKAPQNCSDDRIDGLMMASYPFITEESGEFSSVLVEYDEVEKKKITDPRYDAQWEKYKEV